MLNKMSPSMLILLSAICWNSAIASPLDARDDVVYTQQETHGEGWVNVSPATKGVYVHKPNATHESGRPKEVFMVGKAPRQDFDYLTAEEQEGIWHYRQKIIDDRREAMRIAALPPAATKSVHTQGTLSKLKWPRVIVDGSAVCVPKLEFSEATDWGDHLVCKEVESLHE
jgi:hypothetical protein